MSLLLETHIALCAITGDPTLGDEFLDRLRHDPDIFLSPVTLWEITTRQTAGKLGGPPDLAERVRDTGFRNLPVTHAHAIASGRLPVHHRDPFDRMLVAQAMAEGLTLVTHASTAGPGLERLAEPGAGPAGPPLPGRVHTSLGVGRYVDTDREGGTAHDVRGKPARPAADAG